jgi:lipoprotein-releasing system ATP-binding protein
MLTAKNIHKIYSTPGSRAQKVHVLRGVSLTVQKGEVLVIVGPSGAGKSTLLHVLGGLDLPTQGEVIFDGQSIYGLNDRTRARIRNERVGFIFQFYHLLPEFKAWENAVLPALVRRGARMNAAMKERGMGLLKRVGMEERAEHKPNELSGGEQQRVAIARALVNQPDILFCDEPTGNLDSENGAAVIELLMRLNQENKQTLVIVTHDGQVARRAGRVVYLKDGEILTEHKDAGTADSITGLKADAMSPAARGMTK